MAPKKTRHQKSKPVDPTKAPEASLSTSDLVDVRVSNLQDRRQITLFTLNNELFAVDISLVQEIVAHFELTRAPAMPRAVEGVVNIRGHLIPVLNLKKRLRMANDVYSEKNGLVILQIGTRLTGILVDQVREVTVIENSQIEPVMETVSDELIDGVIKTPTALISLLNPQKLMHFDTGEIFMEKNAPTAKRNDDFLHGDDGRVESHQFVSFFVENDEFAVDIHAVQEINKLLPIAHVPRAPRFVEGVINLRGQIVPLINLRERFQLEKIPYDKQTRIMIINVNGKWVGLIVDRVSKVLRIPLTDIQDPPAETVNQEVRFVHGIAEVDGRLIIILDLQKVLSVQEVQDLEGMRELARETMAAKKEEAEETASPDESAEAE